MICETLTAAEFAPMLENSEAVLNTYARPKEGFLAEDGGRWGVLVLPGGGYGIVAPSEGEPVALAFLGAGVQAFVLKYSVAPVRWPQQLQETAAAITYLRKNARRYGISKDKIAVCGFSAGGHLAGCAANLWNHPVITEGLGFDEEQARPNAAILSYPVTMLRETGENMTRDNLFGDAALVPETSLETSVTRHNPPAFLWTTYTDGTVPMEHTMVYADALRAHEVPFELHIFNKGPHAMGLATPDSAWEADHTDVRAAQWHALCVGWLKNLK